MLRVLEDCKMIQIKKEDGDDRELSTVPLDIIPCRVTCLSRASRCSFSEAVAWCSQASMSPTYLKEQRNSPY